MLRAEDMATPPEAGSELRAVRCMTFLLKRSQDGADSFLSCLACVAWSADSVCHGMKSLASKKAPGLTGCSLSEGLQGQAVCFGRV